MDGQDVVQRAGIEQLGPHRVRRSVPPTGGAPAEIAARGVVGKRGVARQACSTAGGEDSLLEEVVNPGDRRVQTSHIFALRRGAKFGDPFFARFDEFVACVGNVEELNSDVALWEVGRYIDADQYRCIAPAVDAIGAALYAYDDLQMACLGGNVAQVRLLECDRRRRRVETFSEALRQKPAVHDVDSDAMQLQQVVDFTSDQLAGRSRRRLRHPALR
ncbi:plasmid pRiA4b ORF-3 family protein [Babesia caballi]|uniref:Plasmid pRiA4b ORF-3 family protein n=1 Tax=Babesia caballi TaxID=5871 RepID=A0AAV4LUY1_BABCB|nr:plasmid pRiA4b ORF-3 family protein [Babesia caballi]